MIYSTSKDLPVHLAMHITTMLSVENRRLKVNVSISLVSTSTQAKTLEQEEASYKKI
jgi:hypothetical protein